MEEREVKITAITTGFNDFAGFIEELDKTLTEFGVPHYVPPVWDGYAIVLGSEPFTREDAERALGL